MRDFTNHYLVNGTAAIDGSTSANNVYRRSDSLSNVVLFPGVRTNNASNMRTNKVASDSVNGQTRTSARTRANTNALWLEEPDARERLNARKQRAAEAAKTAECGPRAYAEYFSGLVEMMVTSVRDGSCKGSSGPACSKIESTLAGSAVSALCLFAALL